ncbi:MAG: nucleotidyl transferase AbiEii/AbiGii toxin family protein [Erysipelotrichaceae bacterium]|nr:nucleotidyl transferase AbiEii/AbiGii toxin family protein [Erysipelotrichaceae bacterium]
MNFILKGGLLISSMIGISERTTMDMDTTVYKCHHKNVLF